MATDTQYAEVSIQHPPQKLDTSPVYAEKSSGGKIPFKEPFSLQKARPKDARLFLNRALALPLKAIPGRLEERIRRSIQAWSGGDAEDLRTQAQQAKMNLNRAEDQQVFGGDFDEKTLQTIVSIAKHPPLVYPLEVSYTPADLTERFPQGAELVQMLGPETQVNMYAHTTTDVSGIMYTVEKESEKYAFRITSSERPFEEIQEDIQNTPDILPPLQIFRFSDGTIGILSKWMKGKIPETEEEKQRCKDAADALEVIPYEIDNPNTPFDLNASNFKITPDERIYYIDGDILKIIIKHGISVEIPGIRKELLEKGKAKL